MHNKEKEMEPSVMHPVQGPEQEELEHWVARIRRFVPQSAPIRVSFDQPKLKRFRVRLSLRLLGKDLQARSERGNLLQAIHESGSRMLNQVRRVRQRRRAKRRTFHLRLAEAT